MARKLTIGVNWQGKLDFKATDRARENRRRGRHPFDLGRRGVGPRRLHAADAARRAHHSASNLATSIVNIYSRTPAALAQHFATLDELSRRPHDHRTRHQRTAGDRAFPRRQVQSAAHPDEEYVEIINLLMAGHAAELSRQAVQARARIHDALRAAAQAHSDLHRVAQSQERRVHRAKGRRMAAGDDSARARSRSDRGFPRDRRRAPGAIPSPVAVKSPAHDSRHRQVRDRARACQAGTLAFYAARMGTFYAEQLTRFGFGDDVAQDSRRRGRRAARRPGPRRSRERLLDEMGYVGEVEGRARAPRGRGRGGRRPASRWKSTRPTSPATSARSRRWLRDPKQVAQPRGAALYGNGDHYAGNSTLARRSFQ